LTGQQLGEPIRIPTVEDMRAFGEQLAAGFAAGDLVVLTGPLGAGKTSLTQGIGAGLGVTGRVVSPTFVIARVHRGGRLPLVHADAYRLGSVAEVDDLDLDVDTAEAVTVVEWGAGLVEQLADAWLDVHIDRPADSDERWVTLSAQGGDWAARITELGLGLGLGLGPSSDRPS
jgi:tRNA threonylcarbamoyladenosine biosynthesis protein TsaE